MNVQHYKDRLVDLERTLTARTRRESADGHEGFIDSAHDAGDASVADETASEVFAEADRNSNVLQQIHDALARVDAGTFGVCIMGGEPIEENRLAAVPWTAYCLKHERLLEASSGPKTPTL